jgi:ABC-type Fe3+/spermidine/putrescine transport system ATPase subunit
MAAGKVEQLGSPTEVYENPQTAYVADFLGSANVVNVEVIGPGSSGRTAFRLGSATLEASGPTIVPGPGTLVIRPERISLDATADDAVAISATVERTVYLGAMSDVVVLLESGQELVVRKPSELSGNHHRGEKVMVHLRPNAMRLVPSGALAAATVKD